MAAISLFWDTNMAAVTSCENTLYIFFLNKSCLFFRYIKRTEYNYSPILLGCSNLNRKKMLSQVKNFQSNMCVLRFLLCIIAG